jgi:hypothetical protein
MPISEINKQLETGELLLGFGRGRYGFDKFYIDRLIPND